MNIFNSIDDIREYFKRDKFAVFLGFVIEEGEPGRSKVSVKVTNDHLNGADLVHGGFTFTFCDFAGAVATNSYGFISLSINSNISYYNAPKCNELIAVATEVARSRRLSHITVQVFDNCGTHIADFKGTYYITEKEITTI